MCRGLPRVARAQGRKRSRMPSRARRGGADAGLAHRQGLGMRAPAEPAGRGRQARRGDGTGLGRRACSDAVLRRQDRRVQRKRGLHGRQTFEDRRGGRHRRAVVLDAADGLAGQPASPDGMRRLGLEPARLDRGMQVRPAYGDAWHRLAGGGVARWHADPVLDDRVDHRLRRQGRAFGGLGDRRHGCRGRARRDGCRRRRHGGASRRHAAGPRVRPCGRGFRSAWRVPGRRRRSGFGGDVRPDLSVGPRRSPRLRGHGSRSLGCVGRCRRRLGRW